MKDDELSHLLVIKCLGSTIFFSDGHHDCITENICINIILKERWDSPNLF